ncbi:MAG: glutamine-hydrolyzing GMP synthase, partial [Lachnospiraceae bacterium]|nr:glutamine-hydrolyzing GMP synthase [Lachnospiraceae bacterium]
MDKIIVLDFGGQYKQLIARRVRELGVYCEIHPYTRSLEEIREMDPKGIILTGGPASVFLPESPTYEKALFETGIPILGICYGAQLMALRCGGEVKTAPTSEYGRAELIVDKTAEDSLLFQNVEKTSTTWMSHTDYIASAPADFAVTAHTAVCPVAAMEDPERKLYAVQFHPEVVHSVEGTKILKNFVLDICGCAGDWEMAGFAVRTIAELKDKIGEGKVLLGLSGGVDSSVAAALLAKAVGKQLTCVFVDHGLLRKNEAKLVEDTFRPLFGDKLICVDASERFLTALAGVTEPERKRKIIGEAFIRVFEAEAKKLGHVNALAQGTIYPDVIESGKGDSAVIKSHHNVGGLPDVIDFDELVEPLRELFKDEVRRLGETLGLPHELVWRQPFPGPGLAVRILGEITRDKLSRLQEADAIFREEIAAGRP